MTRETQAEAERLATADGEEPALLFAVDEHFNPGVVGLAASRLVEAHYRPAVVAAKGPDETRGSCRSIPEFHITDALDKCADLLVRHGGHAAAAGFTVKNENLSALIERLKSLAEASLGQHDLRPTLLADQELPLSSLSFDLLGQLSQLEPTGYGNPEAVFVSRDVKVRSSRTVGQEGRHLKLILQDERGVTTDAIGFRLGGMQKTLPPRVDLAYVLEFERVQRPHHAPIESEGRAAGRRTGLRNAARIQIVARNADRQRRKRRGLRAPARLVVAVVVVRKTAQVASINAHDVDLAAVDIIHLVEIRRECDPAAVW